ncbi:MAG: hypothetical protein WBA44_07050 [Mesorhizobium sp.]
MFKSIKLAALAAVVGFSALGAAPALADGVYLGLGGGHSGAQVGVWVGDGGRDYRRDRGWDRDRRDYRDYRDNRDRRDWRERRGCQPWQAVNKAERMGLRRARVEDVGRHSIRVAGRARGEFVSLRFAREPGCPLIRR